MATYTITPRDYQYLQAMLNHEAQNTITNDLNRGNTNSAYGQMIGLVETWLNRAMARGTDLPTQMLAPAQLSFFNANNVPTEASGLDPRISQMLDTYLHSRNAGDPGSLGSVNQYLNRDVTDALYSQGYRDWYNRSQLLGVFGDPRSGGRSSLQQEFLSNPAWQVPEYDVRVSPDIRLNPTEGDVNALDDFRNSFRLPTPLPPARPDTGVAGIEPRSQDPGLAGSFDDLRNIWNQVQTGATTVSDAALNFLRNTFGGDQSGTGPMPTEPPRPGTDGFGTNYGSNKGGSINPGVGTGPGGIGGGPDPLGPLGTITQPGGVNYNPPGTLPEFNPINPYGFGGNVSGGVGNGSLNPTLSPYGPAPGDYAFTGLNPSRGVGSGTVGQLPAGFDPNAYLQANPDLAGPLAAMGMSPGEHYLRAGAAEGRALMPANYTPTQGPSTTAPTLNTGTTVGTQGPTTTATTLPPGFNEQAYLQNNPDLVTALQGTGVSPAQHYLRFGMQEGRTFGPPGLSPTLDTGTTVPTQGPTGLNPLTPYTGMNTPTLTPDTTTQTQGPGGLTPLSPSTGTTVPTFGGGGKDAPTLGPSLTPTIGSGTTVPTIGPTTVPTLGPGPTQTATDGTLTPAPTTNLGMTGLGGGITNMPSTNVNTLPPGFNEQAYLQANPDLVQPLAAMGVSPSEHYLRFGMQEGRTIGAPGLSPTLDTATTVPTLNTGVTVPTLNTGVTVPTLNTGVTVPTLGPSTTATAWTPGNMSPYGFSGLNPSGFLGAGPQSFGSLYPVGTGGGIASDGGGGAKGGGADMSNPYGFSGMDVSGFNANAGGGGGQGGGGSQASGDGEMTFGAGFDPASAERNYLAYQEMTNNLQRNAGLDPRAIDFNLHNVALGNGGALPANFSPTALSSNVNQANINLAAMTPVVPNLSLTNLQASYGPRNGPSFGIGGFGGIAGFA